MGKSQGTAVSIRCFHPFGNNVFPSADSVARSMVIGNYVVNPPQKHGDGPPMPIPESSSVCVTGV